jgi:hypothetical protein
LRVTIHRRLEQGAIEVAKLFHALRILEDMLTGLFGKKKTPAGAELLASATGLPLKLRSLM